MGGCWGSGRGFNRRRPILLGRQSAPLKSSMGGSLIVLRRVVHNSGQRMSHFDGERKCHYVGRRRRHTRRPSITLLRIYPGDNSPRWMFSLWIQVTPTRSPPGPLPPNGRSKLATSGRWRYKAQCSCFRNGLWVGLRPPNSQVPVFRKCLGGERRLIIS